MKRQISIGDYRLVFEANGSTHEDIRLAKSISSAITTYCVYSVSNDEFEALYSAIASTRPDVDVLRELDQFTTSHQPIMPKSFWYIDLPIR